MKSTKIIIKSGATDLRRQEQKLIELAEANYQGGVRENTLYAFSNKNNTTIKMIKVNSDSITMIKVKSDKPYPWPGYVEKGKEGYTVELDGKKKSEFLKGIGCPENL